ncbi:unnamed protein product [Rotaria sp. Silwood2]|nr:unnamed protein product [Rotaria sp. Silwood2]CAF3260511.1 unnamed protein product [Rotaria sp. Silwood2]CAF3398414.1 unnamed protein product [Rotaria sp. Silwood2]CAF4266223.1 unnamed protein product [Rotaria sp. Silwood2]CAF4392051.1 unnamed protein product [Rotaria sp. Silwood2]
MTPQLKLIFHDKDAIENQIYCPFLIDTAATMSCIPEKLKPFPVDATYIDIETGAGMQRQKLTKIQVNIDEHCYNVIACINQGSLCILGLDILKYYTLNIDGDKAGVLIKNSLKPNLEEIFTI